MISEHITSMTVDIVPKMTGGPDYFEGFQLCHTIIPLVLVKGTAGIRNWSHCPV